MPVIGNAEPPSAPVETISPAAKVDPIAAAIAAVEARAAQEAPAEAPEAPVGEGMTLADAAALMVQPETFVAQPEATPEAAPAPVAPVQEAAPEEASQKEARKRFLELSRAERKAREQEARARKIELEANQKLAQAQQVQAAMANWKQNPLGLLQTAGVDPNEFLKAIVDGSLKVPDPDPVAEKVQQTVQPYVAELQKREEAITRQQEEIAKQGIIVHQIAPMMRAVESDGTAKFEALLAYHDNDPSRAAKTVFDAVDAHYQRTGQIVPFEEAARQLDEQHERQLASAMDRALELQRFGKRNAKVLEKARRYIETPAVQTAPPAAHNPQAAQAPAAPPTLTQVVAKGPTTLTSRQQHGISPVVPTRQPEPPKPTGHKRRDEINQVLAKFGIK